MLSIKITRQNNHFKVVYKFPILCRWFMKNNSRVSSLNDQHQNVINYFISLCLLIYIFETDTSVSKKQKVIRLL